MQINHGITLKHNAIKLDCVTNIVIGVHCAHLTQCKWDIMANI